MLALIESPGKSLRRTVTCYWGDVVMASTDKTEHNCENNIALVIVYGAVTVNKFSIFCFFKF